MSRRKNLLQVGAAVMMIASSACTRPQPIGLTPNTMRELVMPSLGQRAEAVAELNGEPDRREQVDGREMWVYARLIPEGVGIRSRSAVVWLREGVVVDVDTAAGGLFVPAPTFPPPTPAPSAP